MIYPWLVPHIVFPLYDLVSGAGTWRDVKDARRRQWFPWPRLQERALARLQALAAHAFAKVPFYRESFQGAGLEPADIKSLADLAKVPVVTRHQVRQHHNGALLAQGVTASRQRASFTSGSSGVPLNFFKDKQSESYGRASLLLFREWAKVEPWDAMVWIEHPAHYLSFFHDNPPLVRAARRLLFGELIISLPGLSLQLADLQNSLQGLPPGKDYWIFSFPSYLGRVANQIIKQKACLPRPPKSVISYAETLSPERAQRIKDAFNCPVHNFYSTQESHYMAASCPDNPGLLHINSEYVVLRVVDQEGREVPPGGRGRVLLTDLHNMVMPLINYDLGDLAVKGGPCPCGRGFPTLQAIEGRASELVHTPDGRSIAPSTFGRFLFFAHDYLPYIWEYQIQQESLDRVTLLIVPTEKYSPQCEADLLDELREFLGKRMEVKVQKVDHIPPEPSGKRLMIKSRLSSGPGVKA